MAKLLENYTKEMLQKSGVNIPIGIVASTPQDATSAAEKIGGECVVKALVPMGKKGKAGLIKTAPDPESVGKLTSQIIGAEVSGYKVGKVLIEEKVDIVQELFVSFTWDNIMRSPVLLFSPKGGVDIEELAQQYPELLFRVPINITEGLNPYMARSVCFEAGLNKKQTLSVSKALVSLYNSFYALDARLFEVNPLAITKNEQVCAVGCLCNIDEEALFRHPELTEIVEYGEDRSLGAMTDRERKVVEADQAAPGSGAVRYTEFEGGEIAFGIIGGGASLTVMDAIYRLGMQPANYCDLGPGKGARAKIEALFEAILTKPGIRAFITGANIAGAADISWIPGLIKEMLAKHDIDPTKIPVVARWAGMGDENVREEFESMPGIHFFGAEISIEKAGEKIVELIHAKNQGGN